MKFLQSVCVIFLVCNYILPFPVTPMGTSVKADQTETDSSRLSVGSLLHDCVQFQRSDYENTL